MKSRKKKSSRDVWAMKIFFTVLFAALFIVLSKTRMFPILGTEFNFSMGVMFGPALGGLLGTPLGIASILLSQGIGTIIGLYEVKDMLSLLVFFPILAGSVYFARSLRGDVRTLAIPVACFAGFLLHPIGRQVWFYSLFWLIPVATITFRERIDSLVKHPVARTYTHSLGTAFVDHSVGSVVYLWFLSIPAEFWIAAMPITIAERLIIALGITFSFHGVRAAMKSLRKVSIAAAEAVPESQKEKSPVSVPAY